MKYLEKIPKILWQPNGVIFHIAGGIVVFMVTFIILTLLVLVF